jgi:integrase
MATFSRRPQLTLVSAADDHYPPASDADDQLPTNVTVNMRLPQFFHRWFKPIVIDGEGLAEGTELGYLTLLRWWKQLTSDPPLRLIDPFVVATFSARLRKATYRRGPLGKERPLSAHRVSVMLRNLRALLNRCGAQREPNKQTAGLPLKVPAVPVESIESDPKPCFTLDEAKRIVAAARFIDCPKLDGIEPWQFWRALLAWYYVTSLRRGSLLRLEWSMLRHDGHYCWATVPARLVGKTKKPKRIVLPPWCWREVEHWPRRSERIFLWPHDDDHLNDVHYRLQTLAGIAEEQQLSIQGWRRTHGDAMGNEGLEIAERLAQMALDHSDRRTTKQHYVDFENRVRLRLPPLWDELPPADDRQRRLFD